MIPDRGVAGAYDASADAWVRGPEAVYDALAEALVEVAGLPLAGVRVLDVGAGTGTASRAVRRAGAGVIVAVDLSGAMLRAGGGWDAATACDASALPFAPESFDVAVAAFSVGHLADPVAGLIEVRRVAGALMASAFLAGWSHPAKTIVDEAASSFGFAVPDWYRHLKSGTEQVVDDPDRLAGAAAQAGYDTVATTTCEVDVGLRTAPQMAAWRLGMAHLAPFVASLEPAVRQDLTHACETALVDQSPVIVPMVVLTARG